MNGAVVTLAAAVDILVVLWYGSGWWLLSISAALAEAAEQDGVVLVSCFRLVVFSSCTAEQDLVAVQRILLMLEEQELRGLDWSHWLPPFESYSMFPM